MGAVIIETIPLHGGLCLTLSDQTRHYFGGYYHVRVHVCCDVPLEQSSFSGEAEYLHALKTMGQQVRFERLLEKMAVPETDIAAVRSRLISNFRKTGIAYLAQPDFASRFVRNEFLKRTKSAPRTGIARA